MTDKQFPILDVSIPPMIGRKSIMERLWNDLTKTTPNHLSVVGPRYSGKTVLMNGLAKRMRQDDSPYGAVIYWDLGHQTPDSNTAFLNALSQKIGQELKAIGNENGDFLLDDEAIGYEDLKEVFEVLEKDNFKILMLWDGFDKPLTNGKLTRNLWDQLRELASSPSLRIVTATRRPLRELIRSEESVTSDFWNIFGISPVQVGVFDEDDRKAVMATITGFTLSKGAMSELENWSAGYPPFYLTLINGIIEQGVNGEIDNKMVNEIADKAFEKVGSILADLWDDCSETAKDICRHLVERRALEASKIKKSERMQLEEKNFIKITGNSVEIGCRFIKQHIDSLGDDSGSMVRLFKTREEYQKNIRGL